MGEVAVTILRNEFARRCSYNPRYSLRAYSRSLGLSHTVLSLAFSGKRRPSRSVLAAAFRLSCAETSPSGEWQEIGAQSFAKIASWQHYAVLSLLELPGYGKRPIKLATKLGLTPLQVRLLLKDLERAALVENRLGWKLKRRQLTRANASPEKAASELQRGLLRKAEQVMDQVPFEWRSLSSVTFRMRKEDLPTAIEKIKRFRRKLALELEKPGHEDVYTLAVQLFPLSSVPS